MTDALGSVAYEYNELSQMTAETRDFTDNLPDAPAGGVFRLNYTYALGGQLKSYTDPYGKEINYSQDKVGRLTAVSGTSFGGVTNYADNPQYRAWGALKHLEYGSDQEMNLTYNNRLQAATFNLDNPNDTLAATFDRTYSYYNDGRLKLADNSGTSSFQNKLDRLFTYDHVGRTKNAKSGIEAQGYTATNLLYLPYRQTYTYNALGNLTGRESTLWNYTGGDWDFTYTMLNNRVTNNGYQYDPDGRQTWGDNTSFVYDASGQTVQTTRFENNDTQLTRDGGGREGKRSQRTWNDNDGSWLPWETRYFISSSVLRQNVSETGDTGKKKRTYVIAAGAVVARQGVEVDNRESVGWEHRDPSGLSTRTSWVNNIVGYGEASVSEELDGLGNNIGTHGNLQRPPAPYSNSGSPADRQVFNDMNMGDCELDGILTPCSMVLRAGEALHLEARYWNSREGFTYQHFNFNRDLPGRPIWFSAYIPGSIRDVPDRPSGVDEDGEPIIQVNTAETPGFWFTFASWDFSQQTKDWAPLPGTVELRKQIVDRLDADGGKCRKFLDAVRKNLGIELTVEGLFDKLIEKGGQVVIATDISSVGVAYYGKGGKNIGLAPVTDRSERYINRAIHELFHRGGPGEHRPFARAGFNSLSEADRTKYPFPKEKSPGSRDMDDTFSGYFSRLQNEFCRPPI